MAAKRETHTATQQTEQTAAAGNATLPAFTTETVQEHSTVDPIGLFKLLKAPEYPDCVLLESADLETRKTLQSIIVSRAALKLECRGMNVHVSALSAAGKAFLPALDHELATYCSDDKTENTRTYVFPRSTAADEAQRLTAPNPLTVLRVVHTLAQQQLHEPLAMLLGGFGYEFIDTYEDLQPVTTGPNTFPDYSFLLAQELTLIDHTRSEITASCFNCPTASCENDEFINRLHTALAQLKDEPVARPRHSAISTRPGAKTQQVSTNISDAKFAAIVTQMQQAISRGDIYQVVPSRYFSTPCADPLAAYEQLRAQNPSPYMFFLASSDYVLFGASPESYLKYSAATRKTELYPIAGTRTRGFDQNGNIAPERDARLELSLRTDAKELAEHIMLVDLARNDMARIGAPGSRRVEKLLGVDRYSRVMHLVSQVTCTLDKRFDALDAYRACMNMGTLTGAPKISATNLLRSVETCTRGSYGGAVGYLSADGSFDSCIIIRSAFCQDGNAYVQAGAGVVRDSNPAAEADETFQKASAVLLAIAAAAGNETLEVAK